MANFDYFPDLEARRQRANAFILDNKLRVMHFMDSGNHCWEHNDRFTIVFNNPINSSMVEFAIAMCKPSDQFHKAIGRTIAAERFEAGQTVTVSVEMLDRMLFPKNF